MRVYELAKELGIQSKDMVTQLKDAGFSVQSHMSVLSPEAIKYVKEQQLAKTKKAATKDVAPVKLPQKAKEEATVLSKEHKKIDAEKITKIVQASQEPHKPVIAIEEDEDFDSQTVLVREPASFEELEEQERREQERIKRLLLATGFAGVPLGKTQGARRRKRRKFKQIAKPEQKVAVTAVAIEKGMLLYEVADLFGKSSGDLVLVLLKKGMVCNRNHPLTVDLIKELGNHFGITVTVKAAQQEKQAEVKSAADLAKGVTRWPVVVVMGHVDHGKTTLLDYVRKMNVAATEKGGITQHIRAWEVESAHGKIVFLDTPGHAAFSYLRHRGSQITDLVVLVVAADDGVKPQTVEAIKHAQAAHVPIIVAVNKIDKVQSTSAVETIKRQLAQYELLSEEWGGQTMILPISAKTGKGVEELLEMIVLQSQMMDLRAEVNVPARAFVLESHIEKGLGPVATVICKEGVLKQGDYFVCGEGAGRIRILLDSQGKKIVQALPSTPAQVIGFDNFAGIGDWLTVVSQQEYSRARYQKAPEASMPVQMPQASLLQSLDTKQKYINLIIKTDTRGSKEAIMDSIQGLSRQHKDIKCPIYIVFSGIGDVSEGDIELAENTNSLLVALHVKVEKNAQTFAKEHQVQVKTYQIIYEMIDDLQKLLLSKKEAIVSWVKVGEAVVKKVFDIKGIGIIAGCYMKDGVLGRGNQVACVRGGKEIGRASVSTLQRDRKAVKEVHAGYECGFTTGDGFSEWQEGDTVICYAEVKTEAP